MLRVILLLAIAFILWRIYRTLSQRSAPPSTPVGGRPSSGQVERTRPAPIDYSRVRDASYRERPRDDDEAGRSSGE